MVRNNLLIYLKIILIIITGCERVENLFPKEIEYSLIKEYHCWPYNIKVYKVSKLEIEDSLFYNYPLTEICSGKSNNIRRSCWTNYENIDKFSWSGINKVLKNCEEDELLLKSIKSNKVFYSGCYYEFKDHLGNKRRGYDKVFLLDTDTNLLYMLNDINKVF